MTDYPLRFAPYIESDPPMRLESTWTAPRDHCPYPSRWHSTDQDSTEAEVSQLVSAFVTALRPDLVVETGTNIGMTTYAIGFALAEQGYGELVTFETDPNFCAIARERCHDLPVTVRNHSSLDWDPAAEGQSIDLAFFDSLVQLRSREFARYLPAMHDRTVVAFHDTGPQHPVKGFLDALVEGGTLEPPLYLPTPRGVCFSKPIIPG